MSDTTQPLACSLDADGAVRQVADWSDLKGRAVTRQEVAGGYEVVFPPELTEAVEDLAARESACCGGWMNIETKRVAPGVQLRVTSDRPQALPIIKAMLSP